MSLPTNVVGAAARKGKAKAQKAGKAKANSEAPTDLSPKAKARPVKAAQAETAVKPGADRKAAIRRAADLLKQVSDATRLEILVMLADGPIRVGAICERLGNAGQPAVSHHISLLRHGRLVEPRRQGKENHYSLMDEGRRLVEAVRGLVGGGPGEG